MRRTVTLVLALAAALVFAPAARADSTTIKILRDCIDDGILEGHYTPSELRKARDNMPTDAQEYSDCGDVLSRALSAGVSSGSGGSTGGGGSSSPAAPTATPVPQYSDSVASNPGAATQAADQADDDALTAAAKTGGQGDVIAGRPLEPTSAVAGQFGRHSLPATLVAVLVLFAGALIAIVVPTVRRRVRAHRSP